MTGFHLATGQAKPQQSKPEDKPRFHPVLGFGGAK